MKFSFSEYDVLTILTTPFPVHIAKSMADKRQKSYIAQLRKLRDEMAHGTRLEISEEEFDQQLMRLKNIARNMFQPFEDLIRSWEEKIVHYRCYGDVPSLMQRYESWSQSVLEVRCDIGGSR